MNIFAKTYCRIFQTAFRIALPVLPYREPEIISSCSKLDVVFKKEKVSSVLVVTDKGVAANGLTERRSPFCSTPWSSTPTAMKARMYPNPSLKPSSPKSWCPRTGLIGIYGSMAIPTIHFTAKSKENGKLPQKLWWQGEIPLPYIGAPHAAIKTGEA